jgi:FMN phosphatase YigB (HAD superfamily)
VARTAAPATASANLGGTAGWAASSSSVTLQCLRRPDGEPVFFEAGSPAQSCLATWLARHGRDPSEHVPRLVALYREHEPRISLREGVAELLSDLLARAHQLALLSDGHLAAQQRKWAALAVAAPFSPVIFTDARGRDFWKPHPWSFELAEASSPNASERLYVADNPEKDFVTPNRRGWRTVGIRDPRNLRPRAEGQGDFKPNLWLDGLGCLLRLA